MKNYLASAVLLFSATISLSSCREDSKLPEPKYESIPIVIPEINPAKSYFDYTTAQVPTNALAGRTRPVFEFVVNPSQGYTEIQTVEVYKTYLNGASYGPRVKQMDISSFPTTVTLTSQQALEGLYPSAQVYDVVGGVITTNPVGGPAAAVLPVKALTDALPNRINRPSVAKTAVVFTFEYIMKDGRRITLTRQNTTPNTATTGAVLPVNAFITAPLAAIAEFRN